MSDKTYDLFIIGGGINGCGIARDAAGRGLSVALAEMNDLASATSSASTKLFHGGLRYLEYFEFRLVKEALEERETLLRAMPHISWPMRFVLPYHRDQRFDSETPTSRLLSRRCPSARPGTSATGRSTGRSPATCSGWLAATNPTSGSVHPGSRRPEKRPRRFSSWFARGRCIRRFA